MINFLSINSELPFCLWEGTLDLCNAGRRELRVHVAVAPPGRPMPSVDTNQVPLSHKQNGSAEIFLQKVDHNMSTVDYCGLLSGAVLKRKFLSFSTAACR